MSRIHATKSRVLANEYAISCDLNGFGLTHSRQMAEVTSLCDDGTRFIPGQLSGSLTLRGYFDSTTGSFYTEARDAVGVDDGFQATVMIGTSVGSPAFLTVSDLSEFTVDASHTDAVTTQITGMPDNGVDWGVVLHGPVSEDSTDDESSVDEFVPSSNGGVAHLHVTDFDAITDLVVEVEHSTDDSNWSTLVTFSTATGTTFERRTVSGTINRYVRASWTITGTGGTTFVVALARR